MRRRADAIADSSSIKRSCVSKPPSRAGLPRESTSNKACQRFSQALGIFSANRPSTRPRSGGLKSHHKRGASAGRVASCSWAASPAPLDKARDSTDLLAYRVTVFISKASRTMVKLRTSCERASASRRAGFNKRRPVLGQPTLTHMPQGTQPSREAKIVLTVGHLIRHCLIEELRRDQTWPGRAS